MASVLVSLLHSLRFLVRSRAALHLEIIALRHQLGVVNRSRRGRLRFTSAEACYSHVDRSLVVVPFVDTPDWADCSTTMNGPRECSTELWDTTRTRA